MTTTQRFALIVSAAVAMIILPIAANAQMGPGMGPGTMMGPGIMSRGMMDRLCGPDAAGFAEWRINRIEEIIKPNDAQKAKFEELKAASNKAIEAIRAACPTSLPLTVPGRMEAMEKRTEAMLQAIKTVRPAMDAFYATLDEKQKAFLDSGTGRHRFWHWRGRW